MGHILRSGVIGLVGMVTKVMKLAGSLWAG